jgi:hypothetical protein
MVEQLRGMGIDEERAARFLRHFQPRPTITSWRTCLTLPAITTNR